MRKHAFAGRNTQQMGLRSQMAGMSESTNFPVSAAHVWEVAQILFLATIVNAKIGITFSFGSTPK